MTSGRDLIARAVRKVKPVIESWFCDACKVEVYERRCPHCGKTERERR